MSSEVCSSPLWCLPVSGTVSPRLRWAQHLARLAHGSCLILSGAHNTCFACPAGADKALHRLHSDGPVTVPRVSLSRPLAEPPQGGGLMGVQVAGLSHPGTVPVG